MHAIENSMALYYATAGSMPDSTNLTQMMEDADTSYYAVDILNNPAGQRSLWIKIDDDLVGDGKFSALDEYVLWVTPFTDEGKVKKWGLSGSLADKLGLSNE
jgi:hypothetical protein